MLGHVHRMNEEIFDGKQGRKTAKMMDETNRTNCRAERYKLGRGRNIGPELRSMEEKN